MNARQVNPDSQAQARQQAVEWIGTGALVVVNHSGGADSQAILEATLELAPPAQVVVAHATLGEAEWPGALELAARHAELSGCTFRVAEAGAGFLDLALRRYARRPEVPSWPSPQFRQCTSDLKRGPIQRLIREVARERGAERVISVMGLRAEESRSRARAAIWSEPPALQTRTRRWAQWLPIHDLGREARDALATRQLPLHEAYGGGNERLSCVLCIMASRGDLTRGAARNPRTYARYVAAEQLTGYALHASQRFLPDLTGLQPDPALLAQALTDLGARLAHFQAEAQQARLLQDSPQTIPQERP